MNTDYHDWKEVSTSQTTRHYQIQEWLKKYAEGQWQQKNDCYLFEKETDAIIFKLRWT